MMANLKRLRIIFIIGAILGIASMAFAAHAVYQRTNPTQSSTSDHSSRAVADGTELTSGDFIYQFNSNTLTLISYSGTGNVIDIPTVVQGYPVTAIGKNAFYGNSSIASVSIPSSVSTIGAGAFQGCASLTNVELSEGVTTISDSAFYNCRMLRAVTLPESFKSASPTAFRNCADGFMLYVTEGSQAETYASSNGYEYEYSNGELVG